MIVLPLCPSVNGLYGGGSGQQRFKSKQYKAWLKIVPTVPAEGFKRVALRYTMYFPDRRLRDLGNYEKAITDYLVAQGFIEDDNFNCVYQLTLVFGGIDKENARVEIGLDGEE